MPKVFFGVAPDDDDEYQEPFARVQWGRPGRLTSLKSQRPEKRPKGERPQGRSRWERREIKLAGWVEKTQARAIKASGNRYQVKNRDGRVRGHFRTVEEAEAKAGRVGGFVTDRVEGRRMEGERTRGRAYEVPDPGIFTAQVSDEQWPDEREWPGQYQSTEDDYLEEWR